MIVSDEFDRKNDDAFRLEEIINRLKDDFDCVVLKSYTYEDALDVFHSRADIGCAVIDWGVQREIANERMKPDALVHAIRRKNKSVPIILLTDKMQTTALPNEILPLIDDCIWFGADTAEFLAGRIEDQLKAYEATVYPPFFGMLAEYAEKFKYAWHTPGHMGGTGFLRAPSGAAFYKFYGENTLRSDLSISVPELGSLLDHSGVTGEAEKNSARVFGADQTYYVLNGTSNVNQIIWTSQLSQGDIGLIDRNCHKSLNYGMVRTAAKPIYMVPRRNHRGVIESNGDWFFDMWQPKKVEFEGKMKNFEDVPTEYLATHQQPWVFSKDNNWHDFGDIEDDYVMLDPIKLTFTTPGLNDDGTMAETGIPASVVTNFLIDYNIVCEKTDYYSFLLLNSLGTDRAKQGALLTALFKFKKYYDANALLSEVMPEMVKSYPEAYTGVGLKDHCQALHEYMKKHDMLDKMQLACEVMPDQAMAPVDAYRAVVRGNVEFVELKDMMNRVPAVMVVPYPPGIPMIMGGEIMNEKVAAMHEYLTLRQNFENIFPGYESDIHGVERFERGGKKYFKTLCVKEV